MKKNIFSSEFISITAKIEKYSECKLAILDDDNYWIIAPSTSKLTPINIFENNIYNIEEVEHNFITDLLYIEQLIPSELRGKLHKCNYKLDQNLQEIINTAILEYINKYGFLGLISINKNADGSLNLKNRNSKETTIDSIFIEHSTSLYIDLNLSSKLNHQYLKENAYILPQNISVPKFNPHYAEPIYMILDAIEALYRFKMSWQFYSDNKFKPNDIFISIFDEPIDNTTTWEQYFNTFGYNKYDVFDKTTKYEIGLSCNSFNKIHYTCKSLIDLVRLYLILDIVYNDQIISFCKTCGKPFIKTNPKKEYCSEACRSYYNVNKLRGKNNIKK